MRKRFLVITFLLLLSLMIALVVVLKSEKVLLATLEWAVDSFTELNLEFKNPRISLQEWRVSADEIHLYQDKAVGPALVSILNFKARATLSDLLHSDLQRSDLAADAVIIFIAETDAVKDPQPITWLRHLSWLPDHIRVGTVHLINQEQNVWIFPLKNLVGRRADNDSYVASAEADYDGEPLLISAELLALREDRTYTGIDLRADFDAPETDSKVTVSGELRGTLKDYTYSGALSARYTHVEAFVRGFTEQEPRLRGSLLIDGALHGDSAGYVLEADRIVLNNMPAYGFEASGQLSYDFATQTSEIGAITAGEIAMLEDLGEALSVNFSGFTRTEANARISGSLARPRIDQFILATSHRDGFDVKMSGRLSGEELEQGVAAEDNELFVDIHGASLASLGKWLGDVPFEPGPWAASARLARSGVEKGIAIDNLLVELGTPESALFRLEGEIAAVDLATAPFSRRNISGINVTLSSRTENAAVIGDWLDLPLPPYHALSSSLALSGDGSRLEGRDGELTLTGSDLDVLLADVSLDITGAEELQVANFSGAFRGELSDTSALSQYIDRPVIALGPVKVSARLAQTGSKLAASDISLSVSGPELDFLSTGRIDDLVGMSGATLSNTFRGVQTRETIATLLQDFNYAKPLGTLDGKFLLQKPADAWLIDALSIENSGSERLLLSLTGKQINLSDYSAELLANFRVTDSELLQALSGLQIEPSSGQLSAQTRAGKLALDADLELGGTSVKASGELSAEQGKVTGLRLSLNSPHLHLADLGLQAGAGKRPDYRPAEQLESAVNARFERLTRKAPAFPTHLRLDIEQLSGTNSSIDSLSVELTGVNKAYTLREFNIAYATGSAQLRGIIDLNPDPVAMSVAGLGISIPMNRVTADLGVDTDVQGTLSFRGGVTARGMENAELLQSLQGNMAFALEDATIEGAAYDVLATGILEWMYSGAALEKSTRLDCTMASFTFDRGVARTDDVFVETRKMIATGKATLDLVEQQMDMTLTPRSKSRALQIPSSVRVRGPFSAPRTIVSPVTATADAYAEALVLIPNLALKLFGIKKNAPRSSRPCEAILD
ncbi:AsmA family protein [Halieaceae bacterium]|nr:AsmA family protein [Halieaceae bacterium]